MKTTAPLLSDAFSVAIPFIAIAAAIAFFDPVPGVSYVAAVAVLLVALMFLGVHAWAARKQALNSQKLGHEADAMHWVRQGNSEQEVKDRYAQALASGRIRGAAARGLTGVVMPMVNIDGTPMIEGTVFDFHGNVFGVVPEAEDIATISADGGLMHLDDAYNSPISSTVDPFKP